MIASDAIDEYEYRPVNKYVSVILLLVAGCGVIIASLDDLNSLFWICLASFQKILPGIGRARIF